MKEDVSRGLGPRGRRADDRGLGAVGGPRGRATWQGSGRLGAGSKLKHRKQRRCRAPEKAGGLKWEEGSQPGQAERAQLAEGGRTLSRGPAAPTQRSSRHPEEVRSQGRPPAALPAPMGRQAQPHRAGLPGAPMSRGPWREEPRRLGEGWLSDSASPARAAPVILHNYDKPLPEQADVRRKLMRKGSLPEVAVLAWNDLEYSAHPDRLPPMLPELSVESGSCPVARVPLCLLVTEQAVPLRGCMSGLCRLERTRVPQREGDPDPAAVSPG